MNELTVIQEIAKNSLLGAVLIVLLLKGFPFARWLLETYGPQRATPFAVDSPASPALAEDETTIREIVIELMRRIDRLAEATAANSTVIAQSITTSTKQQEELIRLLSAHDQQTARMEATLARLDSKIA